MTRRLFIAALGCALIATGAVCAQTVTRVLRSLPQVQRAYEDRFEDVSSGQTRQPFRGSASLVPARAFPWTASLGLAGVPAQSGHFCGAAIVAPRWALTAAHCVTDVTRSGASGPVILDPAKIQLLTGTQQLTGGGHLHKISRIVAHPGFWITPQGIPDNDLALLQTTDAMTEAPGPIATADVSEATLRTDEKIGIVGWGSSTLEDNPAISSNLLFAYVDYVDQAKCREAYGNAVTDMMFCAGSGTADACQGDSGGPALGFRNDGEPAIIGIVSWGAGCTRKQFPGVYVNTVNYRGWINETIGTAK